MILMRHAQSAFNAIYSETRVDPGIEDPALTEEGHRQVAAAAQQLTERRIDRIVASPYTRTLQTATTIAGALGLTVTVEPLIRERKGFSCDVGSQRSVLEAAWPELDLDHLDERWWHAGTEPDDEVHARGLAFRAAAAKWVDHASVLVVTHWGFILALTDISAKNGELIEFHP